MRYPRILAQESVIRSKRNETRTHLVSRFVNVIISLGLLLFGLADLVL